MKKLLGQWYWRQIHWCKHECSTWMYVHLRCTCFTSKLSQVHNPFVAEIISSEKKRKRCGTCLGCMSADCGQCTFCVDKPKYGGPGRKKQCCVKRKCANLTSQCQPKASHYYNNVISH